ncbi:MAG TPA: porin family protein [Cytophagaceae bacterium]
MRYFLTYILVILLPGLAMAQTGFKAGINYSTISGYQADYDISSKSKPGFVAGLTFGGYKDRPGVRFEMLISQKGNRYSSTATDSFFLNTIIYTVETNYKNKFTYLDMPLMFTFPASKRFIFEMGPSLGIRLSGKRKGETTVYNKSIIGNQIVYTLSENVKYGDEDVFPNFRKHIHTRVKDRQFPDRNPVSTFDLGLNIGASYMLSSQLALQARYSTGLTDIFRNNYPVVNAGQSKEVHKIISLSVVLLTN